ncbi:hypothetical protein DH2020_036807 [Rehmannia glutinosa]|uniref:Uncharacterized protein n=1 Tax=Rehmannia glutinosa TaxID=99300 RepID=A0ABR0V589_REHGL
MGQGEENKTREEASVEIQERGEIFLFYRPKVDKEEAHGTEDVQRLYLVLRPESGERSVEEKQDPHSGKEGAKRQADEDANQKVEGDGGGHGTQEVNIEKQPLLRFIVMGRKTLPDPAKKSTPYWGFVEMVTTEIEHVKSALKGGEYETATRGHRHLPDSRAVGEGVYRILRHDHPAGKSSRNRHTHLVYKLEFPAEGEQEEPQEALNITREASFIIQIKNPEQQQSSSSSSSSSSFRGLQKKRKASFPAHLQGLLGNKRFHPADPPDFLNYEGCEFLLISASDNIEQELGLELKAEQIHEGCTLQQAEECSDLVKTFGESAVPTRPLFKGTWL